MNAIVIAGADDDPKVVDPDDLADLPTRPARIEQGLQWEYLAVDPGHWRNALARSVQPAVANDLPAVVDPVGEPLNVAGKNRQRRGGMGRIGTPHHRRRVIDAEVTLAYRHAEIVHSIGHAL